MSAKLILALVLAASSGWVFAQPPVHLSETQARHLLVRTGFAPTQAEVDALTGQSAGVAVFGLIAQAQSSPPLQSAYAAPDFVGQTPPLPYRLLTSRQDQQAQRQQQQREGLEMKAWWLREMIASPTPLRERMTLFWHNHFATSQQKVNRSQAMWRQQQVLRANALGSFRSLLHNVAKDPAMLIYLDGANSRKEAPNENFAREVMELFTLGEATHGGNYSERDIREAARAFTGWSVEREDMSFRFRPAWHDDGAKTLLGRTGHFDGDAALDILLEQPAAARFVVGKLWREFVSPTPDGVLVERIARRFEASDYNIAVALGELLLTDAFWLDANRGSLVKSPVDLVVGTVRQFNFSYADALPLALKSAQLGQNLLMPPNVKGWPGQNDWINATTLLERKRFTEQLFRAVALKGEARAPVWVTSPDGTRQITPAAVEAPLTNSTLQTQAAFSGGMAQITFDAGRWLAQYGGDTDREPTDDVKAKLARVLLAVPPTQTIARGTVGVAFLRSLTLDLAYQLK